MHGIRLGLRALMLATVVLVAGQAYAVPLPFIAFDQSVDGGTISFNSNGPLVGTDIRFDTLQGFFTPSESGTVLYCDLGCSLNFETGDLISESGGEYEWAGSGAGTYTLTGALYTGPGATGTLVASGTLLSGGWFSGVEGDVSFVLGNPVSIIIAGDGFDVKNDDILAFYGLSGDFIFNSTQISTDVLSFVPGPEGNFSASVVEADMANFNTSAAVPEPSTLLLLGTGLVALGIRRRNSRA